jgi:hypothetical protein
MGCVRGKTRPDELADPHRTVSSSCAARCMRQKKRLPKGKPPLKIMKMPHLKR